MRPGTEIEPGTVEITLHVALHELGTDAMGPWSLPGWRHHLRLGMFKKVPKHRFVTLSTVVDTISRAYRLEFPQIKDISRSMGVLCICTFPHDTKR